MQQQQDTDRIAAVVVTYNRAEDLRRSLRALNHQTRSLDTLILVDNASTDSTQSVIVESREFFGSALHVIHMADNTGGAGGYYAGMRRAVELNMDRVWLLDDDAEVEQNALEELTKASIGTTQTLCSTCIAKGDRKSLCWPPSRRYQRYEQLAPIVKANFAPFLGYFIHKEIVRRVGLPDPKYFISGDDFEYSLRLQRMGETIDWIKASRLYHPKQSQFSVDVFGRTFKHIHLAGWRRFYDVRNRVWTARKHGSRSWVCLVVASQVVHWLLSLGLQTGRWEQTKAYYSGIKQGLLDRWTAQEELQYVNTTNHARR